MAVGSIIPVLQMRKLRHREIKLLTQIYPTHGRIQSRAAWLQSWVWIFSEEQCACLQGLCTPHAFSCMFLLCFCFFLLTAEEGREVTGSVQGWSSREDAQLGWSPDSDSTSSAQWRLCQAGFTWWRNDWARCGSWGCGEETAERSREGSVRALPGAWSQA